MSYLRISPGLPTLPAAIVSATVMPAANLPIAILPAACCLTALQLRMQWQLLHAHACSADGSEEAEEDAWVSQHQQVAALQARRVGRQGTTFSYVFKSFLDPVAGLVTGLGVKHWSS